MISLRLRRRRQRRQFGAPRVPLSVHLLSQPVHICHQTLPSCKASQMTCCVQGHQGVQPQLGLEISQTAHAAPVHRGRRHTTSQQLSTCLLPPLSLTTQTHAASKYSRTCYGRVRPANEQTCLRLLRPTDTTHPRGPRRPKLLRPFLAPLAQTSAPHTRPRRPQAACERRRLQPREQPQPAPATVLRPPQVEFWRAAAGGASSSQGAARERRARCRQHP